MFIYVIVCSETLKLYVGQHKKEDLQHYLQQKLYEACNRLKAHSHLYAAMRKYPRDSWSIHSLISDLQTRDECDYWERILIKALNAQNPEVGYNICRGGEGNTGPQSDETRRKRSESLQAYYRLGGQAGMKGKTQTEKWKAMRQELGPQFHPSAEHIEKLRQANLGKKKSAEQRQRASEIRKGTMVGKANPFFGRHHSEEANRKNADAHRKPASDETKAKMSASQKARQAKIRLFAP